MLTKDQKADDKNLDKVEVIPPKSESPKLFRAALKVAEQAGIEGAFAKLRKACK